MRKKRLMWNTYCSIIYQVTVVICGFVLSRLVLQYYGSKINGLVNSITQFLALISFLELGVGAVVESSLYKPLAKKNEIGISKIITSANRFFKYLARILLIYVVFLVIFYPFLTSSSFDWVYTAGLIVAISISSFAQYYFGVVDRLLLLADQKGYVQYIAMILTLLANTLACVILMKNGASIHIMKLTTSLIYLVRPFVLRMYINHHYNIQRNIAYTEEPIKQKWNGAAQHIAAVILDGTDNIVLTVFSTLSSVSVYSVYHNVVYGVKMLLMSTTNGIQAVFGELWAKKAIDELRKMFDIVEWILHTATIYVFGCTILLIIPFVQVYTKGIVDTNYIQPLFAVLICLANAGHCLRLPYNMMILAAGHYKQTQHNYIIAAILNIIISIVTVHHWGLVGVAIGTLIAMLYQTIWMALYNIKNIIERPISRFVKQIFVDVVSLMISILGMHYVTLNKISYLAWALVAIKVAFIWAIILLVINLIMFKKNIVLIIKK